MIFAEYDYTLNEMIEPDAMFSFDIADVWLRNGRPGNIGLHW
jgi:hypothetical protein